MLCAIARALAAPTGAAAAPSPPEKWRTAMGPGDLGLGPERGGHGYGPRHTASRRHISARRSWALRWTFFGVEGYCVLANVSAAAELGQLHAFMVRS